MSKLDKTPDQLFAGARSLPPEMSLGRVADIITQFPPSPEPPAGFGITPIILLLMFLLTAFTAGLYLISGPANPATPMLAGAFPAATEGVVETVDTPVAPAPTVASPKTAPEREGAAPVIRRAPSVIDTPLPTFTAPAPAPKETRELAPAPKPVTDKPADGGFTGPTRYAPTGRRDDPIEGRYTLDKSDITLFKTVKIKGRTIMWVLPIDLSAEEQALLEADNYLERESGRLSLQSNEDGFYTGGFTFQPREDVRAGYEQRGWGTSQAPAEEINMTGVVKGLPMREEVYTEEPADLLWLRYFIADVDNGYLGLLDELGFPESSFDELWKLPNAGITKAKLATLIKDVQRLSPLFRGNDIDELLAFHKARLLTGELYRLGYRDVTPLELEALTEARVFSGYVEKIGEQYPTRPSLANIISYRQAGLYATYPGEMSAAFGRELSVGELIQLHEAEVFPANIQRMQRDGFRDLSVAEYIELHSAPRDVAAKMLAENDGMIVDVNYARSGRIKATETKRLRKFSTLIVDKDISVVIIPDEKNHAEIGYTVDPKWLAVKLKVNGRGQLRITKKTRLGVTFKNFIQAEIRLYASDLEKIVVDDRARVFVVGGADKMETTGPVGEAVLVE